MKKVMNMINNIKKITNNVFCENIGGLVVVCCSVVFVELF